MHPVDIDLGSEGSFGQEEQVHVVVENHCTALAVVGETVLEILADAVRFEHD